MRSVNKIEWKEEKRKIKDLKVHDKNPRSISKDAFENLVKDIATMGYHNRIKLTIDNVIIGGSQRKKALLDPRVGYKPYDEISVLVAPRALTDKEFKAEMVKDNTHRGEWDFDMLANEFDDIDLVECGILSKTFWPDEEEKEKEDKPKKKTKECPECGAELLKQGVLNER
jgi:hypothetical protein